MGRSVNVVNFDVVRLFSMSQNLNRPTAIHLVTLKSDTGLGNISDIPAVSLPRLSAHDEA